MSIQSDATTYQAAFFIVPSRIMNLPGLTMAQVKVYEAVFQFWNHGKSCFLSNKCIMKNTGISSESTVKDAFVFFEKHGEMKRIMKGKKRYLVQPQALIETDAPVDNSPKNSSKISHGADRAAGGSRRSGGQGADVAAHNNKKYNNNNLIKAFNNERLKNEQKPKLPFWGKGHPTWDGLYGQKKVASY